MPMRARTTDVAIDLVRLMFARPIFLLVQIGVADDAMHFCIDCVL